MPALLLHLTIAQEVAADRGDDSPLARAARAHPAAYLLGAILVDLPYHARFPLQVAAHFLRRGYLPSEWGDIFHCRGSGRLGLAMLAHQRRAQLAAETRDEVLALVAGYLCHCALDTAVHPEINRQVDFARASRSEPTDVLHIEVERWQSLLYHYDRLGYDFVGTDYAARLTEQVAGVSFLKPGLPAALAAAVRAACIEVHSRAPRPLEIGDWLWGIAAYGKLMGSPLARGEALDRDVEGARRAHYHGPELDLETPLATGGALTHRYWDAAAAVLCAERLSEEVRATYLRRVPDVDLATGA